MNPRSLLLIAAAGIGVLLVVVLTRTYLSGLRNQAGTAQVAEARVAPSVRVLVAKKNLSVGTILTAEDLAWQNWPADNVNPAYFDAKKDKITDLGGKVLRVPLRAGMPLTRETTVAPGDRGYLAATLTPGMRAVTVKVNPTTGVGGFIFPGDRVDVILTQTIGDSRAAQAPVAETVFQNVKVLGVDQRSTDTAGKAIISKTATLEVTPKMAEKVTMLERIGSLSLSLRSLPGGSDSFGADPDSPPLDFSGSVTFGHEVSRFLAEPNGSGPKNSVRVARGSTVTVVELGGKKVPQGTMPQPTDKTDANEGADDEEGNQ